MKTKELLCYLNFAEACMIHTALRREIESGNLTEEAKGCAEVLIKELEDESEGRYRVESLPAHYKGK